MFIFLEYWMVALFIAGVFFLRSFPTDALEVVERAFGRLATRRAPAILFVGVLPLVIRLALLPNLPIPAPGIHDDFGFLLMADTFAHGRVANPTHPMWVHFESIHINQQPTYGTVFFPAQGLLLALGQVTVGHAWVGVWVSGGVMCAAICWMLKAWVPPGWALLGGMLAVMRLATFTYWMNSYSGGFLAAAGGALVLGALPRIKRRARPRDAVFLGLGLALLGNTRPYESLFFCIPIGTATVLWLLGKKRPPWRVIIPKIIFPVTLIVAVTMAGMAYYFWRVTGSPLRTPYQVNLATYLAVPYFPWQSLNLTHGYRHPDLARFYLRDWTLNCYVMARKYPIGTLNGKVQDFLRFYLGEFLMLPLIAAIFTAPSGQTLAKLTSGKTGFLLAVCAVTWMGLALPIYFLPHYAAPITAAIYALVLQSMRYLRLWRWRGKQAGLAAVRAIPTFCLMLFLFRCFAPQLHIPMPVEWQYSWASPSFQNLDRAKVVKQLRDLSGGHLVIVRYRPFHNSDNEWVYNRADIDTAKIVWARDMGDAKNAELIRYFPQRHVWLAEPDLAPPRLYRYGAETPQPASVRGAP